MLPPYPLLVSTPPEEGPAGSIRDRVSEGPCFGGVREDVVNRVSKVSKEYNLLNKPNRPIATFFDRQSWKRAPCHTVFVDNGLRGPR